MVYGESKDLTKRTQSGKILRDKALKIASDDSCNYDSCQIGLVSMVCKLFDKMSSQSGDATGPNYQLAKELHR